MIYFVTPHRRGYAVVDAESLLVVAVFARRLDAVKAARAT